MMEFNECPGRTGRDPEASSDVMCDREDVVKQSSVTPAGGSYRFGLHSIYVGMGYLVESFPETQCSVGKRCLTGDTGLLHSTLYTTFRAGIASQNSLQERSAREA